MMTPYAGKTRFRKILIVISHSSFSTWSGLWPEFSKMTSSACGIRGHLLADLHRRDPVVPPDVDQHRTGDQVQLRPHVGDQLGPLCPATKSSRTRWRSGG